MNMAPACNCDADGGPADLRVLLGDSQKRTVVLLYCQYRYCLPRSPYRLGL